MFKLESYITPYILAYLDKYFKNFNPANFQFSLLSGASFTNLDLNLEVLENEFNLPVTFVSGHIHELRIFGPWTKITYEPIIINVNTIEITLRLKKDGDSTNVGTEGKLQQSNVYSSPKSQIPKAPEEPPGYVQNLINKMITNIRIEFQNVIVKLVEEDIVLTLNVKTASLTPTDSDWVAAFIDLIAPEFALRRKLTFSDMTVCLDRTNSAGKIEQYLEPLLYKCSFEIRMFQKYNNSFSSKPSFTRMDLFSEELKFTITDEQIPMLLRLYNLIFVIKNNIKTYSTHVTDPFGTNQNIPSSTEMSDDIFEDDNDPVMNWATWAMGWIPDISDTVLGVVDAGDSDDADFKPPISHIGFYANKATVVFKGIETVAEHKNSHGARRVKFQPFLKCSVQGIICDMIQRGQDSNLFMGISQILILGVNTCPCGMKDDSTVKGPNVTQEEEKVLDSSLYSPNEYLSIGKVNRLFLQHTLFDEGEILPPEETVFTFENHVEVFTEEMMLNRTSAIAVEYLEVGGTDSELDEKSSHHSNTAMDTVTDLARDKLLSRIVIGPSKMKICSGSIHRIKMIMFAATLYDYESTELQGNLAQINPPSEVNSTNSNPFDFNRVKNMESAYDIYQFTIFRPYVEIVAGDHLDYDQQTHLRAKYKKRKTATITPLSDVLSEWPRMIVTCSCIDGRVTDPNARFRKLMKSPNVVPTPPVLELFKYKLATKVFTAEVKLRSDQLIAPVCIPLNVEFNYTAVGRPEIWPSRFSQISELELALADFRINLSKPRLMLLQVILVSCYDERMSEHLTSTTILRDLQNYSRGDTVIHVTDLQFQAVFTRVLHTTKLKIGSMGIFLHSPHHLTPIPIFEGPPSNRTNPEGLAVIILQYPLNLLEEFPSEDNPDKESSPPDEKQANEMTPLLIVNVSEFIVQFELMFFHWLSYQPKQMPSSIPVSMQTNSQILHPMIPISRTSSRMSAVSRAQSSWSNSDTNENTGQSVTAKDFQQLYQSPASSNMPSIESSRKVREPRDSNVKPEKSTLEEEFNLRFAPFIYIETWQKWIMANLSVIMKSFIMINIGAGEIWFPVVQQQQSTIKSLQEKERNHGVLIVTPKVCALPEGPKTTFSFVEHSRLPVYLPVEYTGRELYPLRITLENLTLSTIHQTEGTQLFALPLSILLTLTLSERKVNDGKQQHAVIGAFLHSDISSIRISLSFVQVKLLLRLVEQLLYTSAVLFDNTGNLMLSYMGSRHVDFQNVEAENYNVDNRMGEPSHSKGSRGSEVINTPQLHAHMDNSSLPETELPNLSESLESSSVQQSGHIQVENIVQETKASIWMQITLAQFQLIVMNPFQEQGQKDQLVFELEDVVSSLDVQSVFVKWSLKIANISLRSYERTSENVWDGLGKCTGIVISSGEEITKAIKILKSSNKRERNLSMSVSGSSSPGPMGGKQSSSNGPATSAASKMRGILTFTYTQVQAKNFHKKSELQSSPIARWNSAIKKYCDNHKDSRYDRYDNEDERYLSEFDLKVGSLDFFLDLTMMNPYMKIFKALSKLKSPMTDEKFMPAYTQAKLPLIYLETNLVRLFFKTTALSSRRVDVPDVLVLQMSSVNIHSQSENPLHRTIVNKELYRMAEHTNILCVPGSPVEDRQYQVDFLEVNIFTCHWKDLKAHSRELHPSPTTRILKTMGENPALEWNTIRSVNVPEEVVAQPILETIDIGIGFAPCIVYEGNMKDVQRHLIIAGHSLEINATSEVYIYANLHQISAVCAIGIELSEMANECLSPSEVESKEEVAAFNFYKESDSGIDSVITLSTNEPVLEEQSEKGSELFSKDGTFSKIILPNAPKTVPLDFLWTACLFQVMSYDLKYHHKREKNKLKSEIVGMVPLITVILGQPHIVLSISEANQRAEISIFELCVGFSPADRKSVTHFSLPDINDFPDRLFECTSGQKDSKTGMTPAFFTAKFTDFYCRPFDFVCDVGRPLKISLCRRIIKNWLRIQSYFDTINWKRSNPKIQTNDSTLPAGQSSIVEDDWMQVLFGKIGTGKISFNQIVLTVIEEAEEDLPRSSAALSLASCDLLIRSRIKNFTQRGSGNVLVPDNVYLDLQLHGLSLRSGIGARRDVMMTPWNLSMKGKFRWYNCKSWPSTATFTGSFITDPISFHIGPQNVLAFLQLHRTFGKYLFDFLAYQEEKLEQIMHVIPGEAAVTCEEYEDDLRAGSFRYVYKDNSYDLPEVYQIAFCKRHRTMTWRYPHKRCLIRVDSFPVPLELDSNQPNSKTKEIPCIVEYWDEAQSKFCHYGILYLSELSRGSLRCPDKKKLHLFTSTIWRVLIELNETDAINLVKPELLAASLRVDSLQDPALNPMLKIYIDIPRVTVHFVSQLTYAGKAPDINLKCYSFGGLTLPDQPFATLELNMNSLLVSLWALKCKVDLNSYLKFTVTEYAYLTSVPVIEPFNFQLFWNLNQMSVSENKTHLKLQLSTKPIGIKVSASVLHTITASLITWVQVLETYNGDIVDFSSFQSRRLVHLAETIICNDLSADILLSQVGSGSPHVTENIQCIGGRECFAFFWPSHKANALCKISVRDPDWKASQVISLNRIGYTVLKIAKTPQKIFVNIKKFSGCQKMVIISGSFSVVNALNEVIEVAALLPKFGGREITWPVQSRSHGPSRLLDVDSLEHLRFRFAGENSALPWSPVVTVEDIRKRRHIFLEMYKEKAGGAIVTYSFWCSYVEELIEGAQRAIIIISPFYRVKSSLPNSTTVYNTVGRNLPEEIFQLEGEGSEQQVDFLGSPEVVHHLTFQSSPQSVHSSPPIALLPGGPDLEKPIASYPIDDIIQAVVASSVDNNEGKQEDQSWPYISDELVIDNWTKCDQLTTDTGMEYTTWIEGLPTVLVDIKPRAMVINLTGQPISYLSEESSSASYEIPSCSVFTPSKFRDPFKLGFESHDQLFWSNPLELTEQKSRTDIHYVNSNSQIPIDSFSRLEIFGNNEICQITLEVRVQRNILTVILRSTFMIQNKTESWLLIKGISLKSRKKVQQASEWLEIPSPQLFYPESKPVGNTKTNASCSPLLVHYSDHSTLVQDEGRYLVQLKYLALSCGGPWWFSQLLKFDLIFNHMPASDGIAGRRCVLSIPKLSPASTILDNKRLSENLEDSSIPVILSWCVKNGQVWISISPDQSPQLILHNLSSKPLFYAQASLNGNTPLQETENFEQYSFLPAGTRSYYTFPTTYAKFPKILTEAQIPSLTIAKIPEKLDSTTTTDTLFHEQNIIYTGGLDWSKPIRVDAGSVHSVQIVDILGVKLTVEQLGLCSHIYIENLSSVEISAKDIRHRILGGIHPSSSHDSLEQVAAVTSKYELNSFNSNTSLDYTKRKSVEANVSNPVTTARDQEMVYLPMEYVIYVPWFRVIFLSHVDDKGKQHETLSLSVQDVVVERFSQIEHIRFRSLRNDELENLVVRVRIGDIQVDTPAFGDKNLDFVVILKSDEEYTPLFSTKNEGFDLFSEQPLKFSRRSLIQLKATYRVTSRITKELQKIHAKVEPVSVFIEKHLLMEVIPIMRDIFSSVEERIPELSMVVALPAAEQFLVVESNSNHSNSMWNFEQSADGQLNDRSNILFNSADELTKTTKKPQVITLHDDLMKINEEMTEILKENELAKEMEFEDGEKQCMTLKVTKNSSIDQQESHVENVSPDSSKMSPNIHQDEEEDSTKSTTEDSRPSKTSKHVDILDDEFVYVLSPSADEENLEHSSEKLIQNKSIRESEYRFTFLNPPPDVAGLLQEFAGNKLHEIEDWDPDWYDFEEDFDVTKTKKWSVSTKSKKTSVPKKTKPKKNEGSVNQSKKNRGATKRKRKDIAHNTQVHSTNEKREKKLKLNDNEVTFCKNDSRDDLDLSIVNVANDWEGQEMFKKNDEEYGVESYVNEDNEVRGIFEGGLFNNSSNISEEKRVHSRPSTSMSLATTVALECNFSETEDFESTIHTMHSPNMYADSGDSIGLEKNYLACGVCDKKFKNERRLRIHKVTHTSKYQCDTCGSKWPSNHALKRHLRVHTEPYRLQQISFDPLTVYLTARITAVFYIAVDRSPIQISEFVRNSILTTHYDLGQDIGNHYLHGIMFRLNNVLNGVGSLELVGSPTSWLREVTTGLHDLVVYPYHGIFDGPTGFFIGLGSGFSSLVKHVAAGTVNSVTNSAWSITRNLDRITDPSEEEDRRSEVVGITDGIGKGFASLGVRMLGAVGGIVHYPIQSVINHGPSTSNILTGVGKGVASIITKPIGGAFELVAMTGEGILKGTGWITVNKAKFKPMLDDIETGCNAPLKYHYKLIREEHEERILLIVDASQSEGEAELNPVTLVLTTENLYIFSTTQDELLVQFPLYKLVVMSTDDRNLLCLRMAPRKKPSEFSVQEERVIEFVRGFASAHSIPEASENGTVLDIGDIQNSNCRNRLGNLNDFGDFYVDHSSKIEFINVLNWASKIIKGEFYRAS